jgi:protein O-mannosyl-transferase
MQPTREPAVQSKPVAWILCGLLVALVACFVHSPQLGGPFYDIDDYSSLVDHPAMAEDSLGSFIKHWSQPHMSMYIPVTYTVWHTIAAISRFDAPDASGHAFPAWPFRVASLTVFAATCGAMVWLGRQLGLTAIAAAVVALVFALHPTQAESVAWITGFRDLLATLFVVLSMIAWMNFGKTQSTNGSWYWLSVALALLAMISKPTAVCVAPMLVVMQRYVLGQDWKRTLAATSPVLAIAACISVVTLIVQQTDYIPNVGPIYRPVVAIDTMGYYFMETVWPARRTFDPGRTPVSLFAGSFDFITFGLGLVAIATLIGVWIFGSRVARLGVATIVLPLVPVLGLVPFQYQGYTTVSDHYLLLSMAGVGLMLSPLVNARTWIAAALLPVFIVWGVLAYTHSERWADPQQMYDHMLLHNPKSMLALNNASAYFIRKNEPQKSLDYSRRAIEVRPDDWGVRFNLAKALTLLGKPEQAVEHWAVCMKLRPKDPETAIQYAGSLWANGRREESIGVIEQAARTHPNNPRVQEQWNAVRRMMKRASTRSTTSPAQD